MARKIWQGDFAQFWFGPRSLRSLPPRRRVKTVADPARKTGERPLGLVEAHRKALREKHVLKLQG